METKGITISPVNVEERKAWDMRAGDTVKVYQKIKEKDKFRVQVFEGLILSRKHGNDAGGTFTVRKIASGVGVEKIFPLYSPAIDKIEVVKRAKVRQSKLYHIRDKATKEINKEMRNVRAMKDVSEVVAVAKEEKAEEAK